MISNIYFQLKYTMILLIATNVNVIFKLFDLTHIWPMFSFYIPLQYKKVFVFLVFSGGSKWDVWSEIG